MAATLAAAMVGRSVCSGSQSTKASGPTTTLEVFSYWTSGPEAAALQALIDDYGKTSPGIKVTNAAVAGGGGANAQAVLQTRLTGNNPPDTWQSSPGCGLRDYTGAHLLASLDDLYATEKWNSVIAPAENLIRADQAAC